MGVPAFFRWLTLRYPKCVVDSHPSNLQHDLPAFDNLYLDMNGIIHPCCRPPDSNIPLTEEEMFANIFKYVDALCAIVRPKKLIYLAIDGVAPRAKMNQQRARRYRKIQEENEKSRHSHTTASNKPPPFDSNVITPGTEFMFRLSEAINEYIQQKLRAEWSDLTVVFSVSDIQDSSDPGEGEHKILQFVREQRTQPSYNPNTKHCIYGADADLIMLSLITHEPHFYIIREQVFDFSSLVCRMCGQTGHFAAECLSQDRSSIHKTKFQFIRIPVLREYLYFEFEMIQQFPHYDFERLIDDFVLICFFVGNDFLPHMPSLNIREGGVDSLLYIYKKNFAKMDGYLTENGEVILPRVDLLMHDLGVIEEPWFKQNLDRKSAAADWQNGRRRGREEEASQTVRKRPREEMEDKGKSQEEKNELAARRMQMQVEMMMGEEPVAEELPGRDWKLQYYRDKFKASPSDLEELISMVRSAYLHGICWVFRYYYQGCCSWGWFYPYHYAPFASDLHHSFTVKIQFALGRPFQPYSQLVGVLPPGSIHAIPIAYRELVLSPMSVICDFFPEDFAIDMNGARFAYQAVILLPFIEEKRLLDALQAREELLSPEERFRNQFGPALFYHRPHHITEAVLIPMDVKPKFQAQEGISIEAVTHPAEVPHTSRLLPGAVEPSSVINRQLFDCSDRATYSGNSQIVLLQKYIGDTDMHATRKNLDGEYFSESYNNNRGICKEPETKRSKVAAEDPRPPKPSLLANLQKLQLLLTKKET